MLRPRRPTSFAPQKSPMDTPHAVEGRRSRRTRLAAILVLIPLIVLGLWFAYRQVWRPTSSVAESNSTSKPSDPRLTFATPYRNVRPDVKYVGDETCAACHATESTSFRRHPMGRSAAWVTGVAPRDRYDKSSKNPFEALGLEFVAEPRGQAVVHKEIRRDGEHHAITELEAVVAMSIGSGTQGRSYAINRAGYLFQSPISWFTDTHSWGLSPGFGESAIHFRRTITVQCLFCHIDHFAPVAHTSQRYAEPLPNQLAIGCERCHGPGQLHVERQEAGESFDGVDDTIVNPRNLEPSLREAVCQQCHLLGEERVMRRGRNAFDYRPGLPLQLIFSTFVRPAELVEGRKTVSHVEQMYLSRCFRASTDQKKLGCISCHDPHQLPAAESRVAFYRERCLKCHDQTSCSLPLEARRSKNKDDSCIECHMPRRSSANVAHAAITDHRVVRRRDRPPEVPLESRSGVQPGQIPLVYFYRDLQERNAPEILRDLGLAMINIARVEDRDEVRREICSRALPFLDMAVHNDPDDIDAQEAQGFGFWVRGNPRKALATLETALAKVPEREVSREDAARIAAQLGQDETAIAHWRKLLAANPWNPAGHYLLAKLLAQRGSWPEAMDEARASIKLDPTEPAPRMLLAAGYLQEGDKKQAQQEFETVERLKPPQLEKLREWFRQQLR